MNTFFRRMFGRMIKRIFSTNTTLTLLCFCSCNVFATEYFVYTLLNSAHIGQHLSGTCHILSSRPPNNLRKESSVPPQAKHFQSEDIWTRKFEERHTILNRFTFEYQTWRLPATLERHGIQPGKFILDATLIYHFSHNRKREHSSMIINHT